MRVLERGERHHKSIFRIQPRKALDDAGNPEDGEEWNTRKGHGPEMEIAQLSPEDADLFLTEYGIAEPGLNRMIRINYDLLGLQSFFTVGEDEVKAWTIPQGATAVEAAGVIHSDLERGFIRAEVVSYKNFIDAGSMNEARKNGTVRLEGRNYIVQDGDILNIRFNI